MNAHPGSNVNQIITFSYMHVFAAFFECMVIIETQNRRSKLQNSNQNSTFPWVTLGEKLDLIRDECCVNVIQI